MAAGGSPLNVQWGFEVADSSIITIDGVSVGFLDGSITVRVPRDVRFLRADQYAAPIDHTVAMRDVFVTFTMKDVLGDSLEYAWDTGAYASSSVKVNTTEQGQVILRINTKGPDGSTRVVTLGTAVSIGEGTWTLPFAEGQSIEAEFQSIAQTGDAGQLLYSVDS